MTDLYRLDMMFAVRMDQLLCSFIRQNSRYCCAKVTVQTTESIAYGRRVYIWDSPVPFRGTSGDRSRTEGWRLREARWHPWRRGARLARHEERRHDTQGVCENE